MEPYFKGVRQISDEMLKAGKGSFEQFAISSGNIESHGVKCGNKYFIYLLNNTGSAISTPLSFMANGKTYSVQYFDPNALSTKAGEKLTATGQKVSINNIRLESKKERVIIVTAN
jgi:hypothetical protein